MNFYKSISLSKKVTDHDIREIVLERGSADFDNPKSSWDSREKKMFKVEAYIFLYLRMHYDHNYAVFRKCCFLDAENICLFDFGCGPMTAGLALLSRRSKTYAGREVLYYGVDASRNMREKCRIMNEKYGLFEESNLFATFKDAVRHRREYIEKDSACVTVVNFSFVLSQETLQGGGKTVDDIYEQITELLILDSSNTCHSIYVIYQNPAEDRFHRNWEILEQKLSQSFGFRDREEEAVYYGRENPVHYVSARLVSK